MDREAYLNLRAHVHQVICDAMQSTVADAEITTNNIMRTLLQTLTAADIKRQRGLQELKNFRRNPDATAPSWAYREPGISSRLPTL